MRNLFVIAVLLLLSGCSSRQAQVNYQTNLDARQPNVLIILADDLGYGDVACYNPASDIATPHLDALAAQGMRFTDAHSAATVCTPTRYALMTGRMCFRTGFRGVFTGVGGPCLIEDERLTLPELMQQAGYATAMFGKWHIGMTFFDQAGQPIRNGGIQGVRQIDYSRAIEGGPVDHGFDHFVGTVCCPTTDYLYAYIHDDRVPVPPTRQHSRDELVVNPYTRDCRDGMIAPDYEMDRVDLVFLEHSQRFMREHVEENPDQPFFLFHSMQAVHLPSLPAEEFRGQSGAGPHGDFIHEMDWIVGQLMNTLEELEIADNTLVIFCSDNGPEAPTVIAMRRDQGHDGARPWRGVKRDQWEGGHRTPFIVRWPGRVEAGSVTDQPVSTTDLFATCAALTVYPMPNAAAEDSFNMLPVFVGEQGDEQVRPYVLQQTMRNALSIRVGDWKYLDHQGSGGNDYNRAPPWGMRDYALPDTDPDAPGQLYNLAEDPGETTNLYSQHPRIVAELKALLDATVEAGRSAPQR